MTMNKRAWVSTTVLVAALVAGFSVWRFAIHQDQSAPSDCQIARNMISYNKSQSQNLAKAFNPDQDREASIADYRNWANHLQDDAARISSAGIATHAHRLADDANQMVDLVKQVRSDTSTPADPSAPPSWAKPYADLSKQFHDELVALKQACPA